MPFVELNAVFNEEFAVFVLERHHAMMLALAADVIAHVLDGRRADGEGTVAVLPMERVQLGPLLLEPEVGTGFELAYDIAQRLGAGGEEEEVHMIRFGIDLDRRAAEIAEDAAEVGVESGAKIVGEQALAVLRAEDEWT